MIDEGKIREDEMVGWLMRWEKMIDEGEKK